MFGSSLLIAPKLNFTQPAEADIKEGERTMGGPEEMFILDNESAPTEETLDVYLPRQAEWFDFKTNKFIGNGEYKTTESAYIFVRAGSILPILLHQNALSLQRAIVNDIAIKVFVSKGKAVGLLYLDDGISFNYNLQQQRSVITYIWDDWKLSVAKSQKGSWDGARLINIAQLDIYFDKKVDRCPSTVKDFWTGNVLKIKNESSPKDAAKSRRDQLTAICDPNSIHVKGLATPVEFGFQVDLILDLIQFNF